MLPLLLLMWALLLLLLRNLHQWFWLGGIRHPIAAQLLLHLEKYVRRLVVFFTFHFSSPPPCVAHNVHLSVLIVHRETEEGTWAAFNSNNQS